MATHDTIGDFLTIIRNAAHAKKATCQVQWSNVREGIARILKSEGYISDYAKGENEAGLPRLEVSLKYVNGLSAITGIQRYSKPGCRRYFHSTEIPRVLGGLGICILTTSKGIIKGSDARQQKVGGELLAKVW
ncbi:MAG: 30S ribosomal protein S8 [Verrucomicrobia bacterium 21-51-4]|nr:MAG: 30S ribosomal protein S8 [Verrucomicrobia bacterium 21-51-4]HQU08841.1 30S ribosomal protein S8 [Opitutales bacterium]